MLRNNQEERQRKAPLHERIYYVTFRSTSKKYGGKYSTLYAPNKREAENKAYSRFGSDVYCVRTKNEWQKCTARTLLKPIQTNSV